MSAPICTRAYVFAAHQPGDGTRYGFVVAVYGGFAYVSSAGDGAGCSFRAEPWMWRKMDDPPDCGGYRTWALEDGEHRLTHAKADANAGGAPKDTNPWTALAALVCAREAMRLDAARLDEAAALGVARG